MIQKDINIVITCIIGFVLLFSVEAKAIHLPPDSITPQSDGNIIQKKDTVSFAGLPKEYQTLKQQSSKNRWTKRLFSLIFRETKSSEETNENKAIINDYKPFEGKIIRNININVLAPFGTDLSNPDYEEQELNFVNNLHVLTRKSTIKNIIQFKEKTRVNAAIVASSEAQLRNAGYIYDARIKVVPIESTTDSVDISIIVRDKWTIGVNLHSLSNSKVNVEMFDRNILGSGSRIGLDFIYSNKYDNKKFGYGGNYVYENIAHTNIDLAGSYLDKIRAYELSLSATRALQPKLKHFGEISYEKEVVRPEVSGWDSISPDRNEIFSATAGRAFTLSDENVIRRLAIGLRYKIKSPEYHYNDYQNHVKDILLPYKYTKNRMLLMQVSLYQNSYQREYMVYNFGNTEDIAQGYNLSMQLGYSQFDHIKNSMYSSFSASYGSNEVLKGNIYINSAISTFFNKKESYESLYKFEARYFTPLMRLSQLRLRQFLSVNYSKLFNPDRYFGDRIYMGEHTTLKMRDWRNDKKGVEYLMFKSETDIFSNYEIAGFRFLFYSFLDMGWITPKGKLFSNDNFNYGVGVGIRLRNNFIILNTIDLKIGFYPKLEQSGFQNFFKVSSSTPNIYPNFVPSIPEEILLE